MKAELLARLVSAPSDSDYVENFQALADVNVALHDKGPTARLLLRKALFELDLGNFTAARRSAQDALDLDPDMAEAHYQEGLSSLLLAFARAGVVPGGPGHAATPMESIESLLQAAARSFGHAIRLNPDDPEVQEDLAALSRLMARHPTARDLARMLQE